jgi:GNAT superfamily N-acetyltransferase
MQGAVMDARRGYRPEAKVIMAWEENRLMGWALVFDEASTSAVHVYVRASERRKGIGSKLLRRATRVKPEVTAVPWDEPSRALYAKHDLKPHPAYHYDERTGLCR